MYVLNMSYEQNNFITQGTNKEEFYRSIEFKDRCLKRIMRTIPDNVATPKISLDWVHCTASHERVIISDTKEEYIKAFFKSLSNTNISLFELILEDRIYILNTLGRVPKYVNCSMFCLYPVGGQEYKLSNELEYIRIIMKYGVFIRKERIDMLWVGVLYILARKIAISYLVDRYINPKTGDPTELSFRPDISTLTNEVLNLMLEHEAFPLNDVLKVIQTFKEMDDLYIRI